MGLKALGQFYLRHHNAIQTVGLLAYLTEEVGMLVVIMLVAMTVTEFIFRSIATTFDGMIYR